MSVRERVAAGQKFLEMHGPEEWWNKVSLKTLDMRNPCTCVLGQAYSAPAWPHPGFFFIRDNLDLSMAELVAMGFEAYDEDQQDYSALYCEWTRVIRQRRGIE